MTRSMPIDRGHSDCDQCRLAVAVREGEQLRAEISLLRADVTILRAGAVPITDEDLDHFESGVEQGREEALEEREQLRALLRQVRRCYCESPDDSGNVGKVAGLIDSSGLLADRNAADG